VPTAEIMGHIPEIGDPDGTTDPVDPLGIQVEVPEVVPLVEQSEDDVPDAIDNEKAYSVIIL
jgi:hypothetical protein